MFVAGVTGLEPATSGLTGRRSNQLSYTPVSGCPHTADSEGDSIGTARLCPQVRASRRAPARTGARGPFCSSLYYWTTVMTTVEPVVAFVPLAGL
jgi:hypothetical protein